ncbi:hypothetical protein J6Z19_08775 [bacterium]|nr:hypothetical protein [bacterium]
MKRIKMLSVLLLIFCGVVSCGGKRPYNGTLEFDITLKTIQKNAEVSVLSGKTVIAAGKTDEEGECRFDSVRNIGDLVIKICGGTVDLVSSDEAVAWNGCMEKGVKTGESGEIKATVDFLSAFIEKYESETSESEWFGYLDISADAYPELQSSLTDATRRWLWIQSLAKIAESVSKANGTVPETQFSTENLLNLLFDDLTDDNVINGSTSAKFGTLPVNAAVLKVFAADFVGKVSDRFSEAELKEWSDKLRNSEAAFLGGENSGAGGVEITITAYPEGMEGADPEYFSGNVAVKAFAEPEKSVVSLNCSANGEKITDTDEKTAFFKGTFSTSEIKSGVVVISCDASDGIDIKTEEKSILVDNNAPLLKAVFYESGTNIVTGTEENPAKGKVDLKVSAAHEKYAVDGVSCSIENYSIVNTATASYQYNAEVNTAELPEWKNILHCNATMNNNKFSADFDFYVRNSVSVAVKPFIANALGSVKSVDVDCGNDFKRHYAGLQKVELKRGQICVVSVSGGQFESVTLSADSKDLREFNGTLSAVVIPESDADIVVTPITTIDEIVYSSRIAAGAGENETFKKSKESMLNHFSNSFKWSDEPKNTKSMDNSTKYFILLAGLENLSYFLEMQIDSEHGAYNIGSILGLLRDDYSDLTFDGKKNNSKLVFGTENTFELDSNFFRYYYATAVKRFLLSSFNKTNITNIGSILNQISMNSDQFLFPAESEAIAIDSDGPVIEISGFQNLLQYVPEEERDSSDVVGELGFYLPLGGEIQYKAGKYPYFAKAFVLNFTLKPNNGNFIDLNSLEISGNDSAKFEYTRLVPAEIHGDGFTNRETSFSYLVEYDDSDRAGKEKEVGFTVSAEDVAFNGSSAAVKTFLDSQAPVFKFSLPENMLTNGHDGFKIESEISDNALSEVEYCLEKINVNEEESGGEVAVKTTIKCSTDTFSEPKKNESRVIDAVQIAENVHEAVEDGIISGTDGKYALRITATDKAGNRRTEIKEFEIDAEPPENYMVRSYNTKNNLYLFDGWDNLPQWLYVTRSTSTKIDLTADEDAGLWSVRLRCCGAVSSDGYGFFSDCSAGEEWFERKNLAADETALFEGLPEFAECRGKVQVCDKTGNCSDWNEIDFSNDDLSSYIQTPSLHHKLPQIWFIIDTVAPTISTIDVVSQECVYEHNSQTHLLFGCTTNPRCPPDTSVTLYQEYPRVLVKYENNEAAYVTIRSLDGAWDDRYCVTKCENMFYCDLRGSKNGYNNFKLIACDAVGNCKEDNISENMDMSVVEPINLNVTNGFFTEQKSTEVSWANKNGVSYTCRISKEGDGSYSENCTNGQTIKAANLNGTGSYVITVDSSSSSTSRSDQIRFIYFNTADLNTTFTPVTGQILKKNGNFKFDSRILSSDNLARISKIEYYLYGLYKNGESTDTNEYLVTSSSWSVPVSGFGNTVETRLNPDVYGQFRNLRAKITFADGTVITRNAVKSQADSFLYCMLGGSEKLDDVQMNFSGNQLLVVYKKPDCFTENEYKLSIETKNPSQCDGIPSINEDLFDTGSSGGSYFISAQHTLWSQHKHCNSDNACVVSAGCYADIHAFSKETAAVLTYTINNKTYRIPATSFDWKNVPVEWRHVGSGTACHKCDSLPKTVSCDGGESKTLVLKK